MARDRNIGIASAVPVGIGDNFLMRISREVGLHALPPDARRGRVACVEITAGRRQQVQRPGLEVSGRVVAVVRRLIESIAEVDCIGRSCKHRNSESDE